MTEIFADTFYWLALLNVDDVDHEKVTSTEIAGRLVVTWAIQMEVMDAFSSERFRPLACEFWEACQGNAELIVVPLDRGLLATATELFRNRPDKNWSFTDCISFTVMNNRGIMDSLTGDHHFSQAGFRAIFRE
jgi:predicted nucleic acid-binding protein